MVPNRSNRERFKVAVYSVLGVHLAFLLLLLAHGYNTDATTITIPSGEPADSPASPTDRTMAAEQKPVPKSAGSPSVTSQLSTSGAEAAVQTGQPSNKESSSGAEAIHIVKSGETLSSIARIHGTNVRVIKAANHLKDERLAVGTRLRVPDSKLLATAMAH